jgi:hypothetical protein
VWGRAFSPSIRTLNQHQQQQAHQRAARVERRAQARLTCSNSSSQESSSQSVLEVEPSVVPPPPESGAKLPAPSRPSTQRKRKSHHNTVSARVKCSPEDSSRGSEEVCLCCGTAIVQSRGRTKRYCSDRCRVCAYHQRQASVAPLTVPFAPVPYGVNISPEESGEGSQETCLCCGTPLAQSRSRTRRYCSDSCRVRAYYQRQASASPLSPPVNVSPENSGDGRRDTCLFCGICIEQSIRSRRTRRYCSDRCRARAYQKRQASATSQSLPDSPTSHEVKASPKVSGGARRDSCLFCGTCIEQSVGGRRTRRYCSDSCRVRAYYQRRGRGLPLFSSHNPTSHEVKAPRTQLSEERPDTCLRCETPLVRSGGRIKRYCSDRCRVQADSERQKKGA